MRALQYKYIRWERDGPLGQGLGYGPTVIDLRIRCINDHFTVTDMIRGHYACGMMPNAITQ